MVHGKIKVLFLCFIGERKVWGGGGSDHFVKDFKIPNFTFDYSFFLTNLRKLKDSYIYI